MSRSAVLLSAVSFERDTEDIPIISPGGFDWILKVSFYDSPETGNCHEEFTDLLGYYVKFPLKEEK